MRSKMMIAAAAMLVSGLAQAEQPLPQCTDAAVREEALLVYQTAAAQTGLTWEDVGGAAIEKALEGLTTNPKSKIKMLKRNLAQGWRVKPSDIDAHECKGEAGSIRISVYVVRNPNDAEDWGVAALSNVRFVQGTSPGFMSE